MAQVTSDDDRAHLLESQKGPNVDAKPQINQLGSKADHDFAVEGLTLAACFVTLHLSYVTWGVMQEKIMTTEYETGRIPTPTFLVFCNRMWAMIIAFGILQYKKNNKTLPEDCSPYWYAPCAISNVMSSWCQYKVLLFVTFPTQVLFKSSKLIPVMLVGKFLHGQQYPFTEYMEAVVISFGIGLFMLTNAEEKESDESSSFFGIMLLCAYVFFDSFTSQWQSAVFKKQKVDQYQMMFGVNAWSIFMTLGALVLSGEFWNCVSFAMSNGDAFFQILLMSVCATTGQLAIYYTIKRFGPIVLTIIMQTRQINSMVVSATLFNHVVGGQAWVGAFIVFAVIAYRSHRNYTKKRKATPKS